MKFYKLSHGQKYLNNKQTQLLKDTNLVSVYPFTNAKGQSSKSQGEDFLSAKKGDLFYVCRSNDSIEFIGMFVDERPLFSIIKREDEWTDREYVLIENAVAPEAHDKSLDKWWSPKNNSTFIEIPLSDKTLFEKEILQPVFNTTYAEIEAKREAALAKLVPTMDDYIAMQLEYDTLMKDERILFQKINALGTIELKKIQYTYLQRGDISAKPVVLLRSKLLDLLLQKTNLDALIINELKKELDASFEKKVYQAWSSNFRILYTFLFDKEKVSLENYFKGLIHQIQEDLEIQQETKVKLVHFDGAQNQGNNRLWFAIYNKIYKSQKLAKQLFLEIHNGLTFGLLDFADSSNNQLKHADTFNYQDILGTYALLKKEILNDTSMEKAKLSEYIDILKYKKQIILQGPPGTGKTYTAKKIAAHLAGSRSVTSYESLTKESIEDSISVGDTIANASGVADYYTIDEITESAIMLSSERANQAWDASFKNIIKKYNELTNGIQPTNINGKEPYELAVAKYLFENREPSKTSYEANYNIVQFHPSYSYEDFVRGISVKNENGSIVYKTENKIIAELSQLASQKSSLEDYDLAAEYEEYLYQKGKEAEANGTHYYFDKEETIRLLDIWGYHKNAVGNLRYKTLSDDGSWYMQTWINMEEYNLENWNDPESHKLVNFNRHEHYIIWQNFTAFVNRLENNNYVLIIDEINRANLPSVLGELIYALEYRGDEVNSMYAIDGNTKITIPKNLYIIGTMNTADRSVGHIDYAIKRRFAFVDMLPNEEVIQYEKAKELFKLVSALFTEKFLAPDFDAKDIHLGHSYFLVEEKETTEFTESERLQMKLDYEIIPILNEYVKDGILLEIAKEEIKKIAKFVC
ncbi:AAA family ATPase [Kordia sp.]|uniref:AAA family ATPase n=1 Tax=Kordia sp. TaxID=1965332 RepID=UPI003B5AFE59